MSEQQRSNRRAGDRNFTEGSVRSHLVRLTGYMTMGFLAMNVARLAEAAFVGMIGTDELAALAFNFPIVMALSSAARGLGVGASSVVARSMGGGDRQRAAILVTHCMWLTLAFTFLCVAASIPAAEGLLGLLGAEGRVLELSVDYFVVWILGLPLFALSMVGTSLLRATGDAATPGYVQTMGSVLQIILSPPLIFGWGSIPEFGVVGAALAHVIARAISFFYSLYLFVFRDRLIVFRFTGILAAWRDILHVGLPATMTNLIGPVSNGVITRLLAEYGPAVVAGFGVATRVDSIVMMVLISLGGGAAPFIGQNWGAGKVDRVSEALRLSYRFCLGFGLVAAVLMALVGEPIVALINDDPDVVETAGMFFLIVPISIGFMGMSNVASSSFNALGKPIPPLVLSINRMIVLYIPLAMLGSHWFGYVGIFAATSLANVLNGLASAYWNKVSIDRAVKAIPASASGRR